MTAQMKSLDSIGVLSRFIGMLTDSRSFLSYPRHEYFRRILCELVGGWIEKGMAPADYDTIGGIIEDICFSNAWSYMGLCPLSGARLLRLSARGKEEDS